MIDLGHQEANLLLCELMSLGPVTYTLLERFVQFAHRLLHHAALGYLRRQSVVGILQLPLLEEQFHQNSYLGTQNGWIYRLQQVVHRSAVVTFDYVLILVVIGSKEYDRHPRRFLPLLDQIGRAS